MTAYARQEKERANARHRAWVARNRDHVNAYNREWNRKQDDEYRERKRSYNRDLARDVQRQAIAAYGGFCACCGETEPKFLQLDHVNNDGAEHRRQINGVKLATWLRQQDYPDGFQVLCANCNFAKHTNGGTCPHQERVAEVLRVSLDPDHPHDLVDL